MGLRHTLRLYKGTDATTLREGMVEAAKSLGGSIRWGLTCAGNRDLRLSHCGDVHTFNLPYQRVDFSFCQALGRLLGLPWLELRIQEGTLWDYILYRGEDVLDTFSVCPQFWEGGKADSKKMKQWQGKPEVLADAWDLPVKRIRRYLVNWGFVSDPNKGTFKFTRKGKAYPSDKHSYGDYEQFFDVLRALGGQEPVDQHRISLPKKR